MVQIGESGLTPSISSAQGKTGSKEVASRRSAREFAAPLLLIFLPLILLWLDPNWIISKLMRDPWIYFGYYLDLPGHLRQFPDQYYGARLSFLLPGFLIHKLLPTLAANHILHLTTYYVSIFSMYFAVERTVGRRAALLATVALGTQPYFVEAAGRDYADGFGIMFFLLGLAAVSQARRVHRPGLMLALAGAASTALVAANLFYVVLVPPLLFEYLSWPSQETLVSRVKSLGWYLLGWSTMLLVLCLCSRSMGGRLWFLSPSIQYVLQGGGLRNPGGLNVLTMLLWRGNLALPMLTLLGLGGAFSAARQAPTAGERAGGVSYVYYLIYLLLVFMIYDWNKCVIFYNYFYSSLTIPFCLLALTPAFSRLAQNLDQDQFAILVAIQSVTGVVSCAAPAIGLVGNDLYDRFGFGPLVLAAPGAIVGAMILWERKPGMTCACAFVLCAGLSQYLSRPLVECEVDLPNSNQLRQARFLRTPSHGCVARSDRWHEPDA